MQRAGTGNRELPTNNRAGGPRVIQGDIMLKEFLSSVNYWAVAASGLAYRILGAVWFSALFGSIWGIELEKHGVKIKEPTKREMLELVS